MRFSVATVSTALASLRGSRPPLPARRRSMFEQCGRRARFSHAPSHCEREQCRRHARFLQAPSHCARAGGERGSLRHLRPVRADTLFVAVRRARKSGAGAWCRESLSAAWASGSSAPWPQDLRRRHEVASRQRLDAGGPPRGWGRIGCRAPVWCLSDPDGGGRVMLAM